MTYQNSLPILRFLAGPMLFVLHRHDNGLMELDPTSTQRNLRKATLIVGCSNDVVKNPDRHILGLAYHYGF